MMNKFVGYILVIIDKYDLIVLDLIDLLYLVFELFFVGRLDKDIEGLLVLINDGKFFYRVLFFKKYVFKIYYVKIDGVVIEEDVEVFLEGVVFDDGYKIMLL